MIALRKDVLFMKLAMNSIRVEIILKLNKSERCNIYPRRDIIDECKVDNLLIANLSLRKYPRVPF